MKTRNTAGGTYRILAVKDEAGNEYACIADALRDPEIVREEEKEHCEPKTRS